MEPGFLCLSLFFSERSKPLKKKAEIIWALVFIAFAAAFYYLTLGLRPSAGPDVGGKMQRAYLILKMVGLKM